LNDLWKYQVRDNTWTWVAGKSTGGQKGNYVTKGDPDSGSEPGGRELAIAWFDSLREEFWLFSGLGSDCCNGIGM